MHSHRRYVLRTHRLYEVRAGPAGLPYEAYRSLVNPARWRNTVHASGGNQDSGNVTCYRSHDNPIASYRNP